MKIEDALYEIAELTRHVGSRPLETALPGVLVVRGEVPAHQLAAVYEPVIGFTIQGTKVISIGEDVIHASAPSYYVIPTDIPATGMARKGKNGAPYLSAGLSINRETLLNLLNDLHQDPWKEKAQNFSACEASPEFIDVWLRMFRLLKTPQDIPALFPVYEREILYRALLGPQGWRLKQLCLKNGKDSGIQQAVKWIRSHFAKTIDIKLIAAKWGMGVTTFHRQFKLVTGLSPIQFQKQLRLLEARKLIAFEGLQVANAAYQVGYQSASQFNREYARFFGEAPARDTAKLRIIESARD